MNHRRPSRAIWQATLLALLALSLPAYARITKTRYGATANNGTLQEQALWSPLYSTVIGSGFEYTKFDGDTESAFPFLIEYNFSETLKLTLEPKFIDFKSSDPEIGSISGWSDTEAFVEWEFLRERRYRPALNLEAGIRFPTAQHPDLGDPGYGYSLGLIASKDLVYLDVDLNARYTLGTGGSTNDFELSAALAWHLTHKLDLINEIAFTRKTGHDQNAREMESTVGLSWVANKHLTLEAGVVFKEHGEHEFVIAWEWAFGGND